jgi:hypothetical protein
VGAGGWGLSHALANHAIIRCYNYNNNINFDNIRRETISLSGRIIPIICSLFTQNLAVITKDRAVFFGGFFVVYDK